MALRKLGAVLAATGTLALAAFGLAGCGGDDESGGGGGEGGTMRGAFASFPDYLDPALSYTVEGWTALNASYIPLLTYAREDGEAGSEVIPGLAEDLPKISNGGKTYTLKLRQGLEYSDGSPVKASDFGFAVERMIRLNSGGLPFYMAIVGAEAFLEEKADEISGIKADDKTGEIVIDLTSPRGPFNNELALMFVAPLPQDTPIKNLTVDPPPATGPYEIIDSEPGRGWSYQRNPAWQKTNSKLVDGISDGHFDRIDIDVIRNQSSQVTDVEQGNLQWMQTFPPADRIAAVKEKFEGSQFRVEPTISNYFFWMNTAEPPFDDLKVRQAVNHAINGAAMERIYSGSLTPIQQILPPGMPGYEKLELYPFDLKKAKELIAEANPTDRDITVWTDNESPQDDAGAYYQDVLKGLGFNAKLKILNADDYYTVIGNQSTQDLDTGFASWYLDYPHPNDFFQPLLAGESILETNNGNFAMIDDPALNRKITELAEAELGSEQEAEYAQLDREYMEQAPWAPYGARNATTFVSSDIDLDAVVYNLTLGQDLTTFQTK
jgi:peptide/nickel transport system substrate-binding protein